jgi:hypothetical protein
MANAALTARSFLMGQLRSVPACQGMTLIRTVADLTVVVYEEHRPNKRQGGVAFVLTSFACSASTVNRL